MSESAVIGGAPVRAYREEEIVDLIRQWAIAHDVGEVADVSSTFTDAGFDSLHSIEVALHLEAAIGVPVDDTVLYNCPTIESLAAYLAQKTRPRSADADASAAQQPVPAGDW